MYDYRSPRHSRKVTRPLQRRLVVKKPKTIRIPPRKTKNSETTSATQIGRSIIRGLTYAVVALIMLAISGYFLGRILLPMMFPLERDTVVVFVSPAGSQDASIVLVAFKPSGTSLVGTSLTLSALPNPIPSDEAHTSPAAWSQSLRLIVDQVLPLNQNTAKLEKSSHITRALWQDVSQTSAHKWLGLSQLRLWIFAQTLSSSQQRWLEIETPPQWDRSKFQFALGNQFLQCPVGVINTTSTSGLATNLSNLVEESGYPVVQLSDNRDNVEQSTIFFDPEVPECQLEAERLSHLMISSPKIEANADAVRRHRAQIVIYLGQDMVKIEETLEP